LRALNSEHDISVLVDVVSVRLICVFGYNLKHFCDLRSCHLQAAHRERSRLH